uniref:RNA helicase n=1 Tax=Kalanchoe fedtschenkoi TaxID=63787 RepID=A0A7N0U8I5_KALFE
MASTAYPEEPTADKFSSLPIMHLKQKIVEKIMENRVTLIVGETGCGKSSQVPQFLLEKRVEPILCTQPRRFAVVAVARMVAKSRNCEVGTEVGYHIGHSKVLSKGSKIVFKTAGVLLDEMRDKGLNALKYKVIILDEVHERSVESDLVLVCVKQLMLKNNDLRVVLMSATADIARYKDYFRDLGRGERVEVLAIPNSNERSLFQRKVLYIEQVVALLGKTTDSSDSLSVAYCNGPTPDTAEPSLKPELHSFIHDLVMHIHKNEDDVEKSILIFLPTYNSLEQQWSLLKPHSSLFKVHILHSSIDTELALSAMEIWKFHRKVILATNIAESSVTIPKAAFVIDSCRSLQVYWDSNRKAEASHLAWVSKSQAEQRRGRTGRTCDGQVYRLVTGSFFNMLKDHESPAILKLSLRQQVLSICCSEMRAINDPKVLMQKTMDPPDPEVVEDALSLLVRIRALKNVSPRGRYEPTFYGKLLSSFSLSFDASVLIVKFGYAGMLREGILLGILMDTQPHPILRPFGEENLFATYSDCYYEGGTRKESLLSGKKELNMMANLCAYQFWQRVFKDKHRLESLKRLLKHSNRKGNDSLLSQIEEEWCLFHKLVKSSLHQISEIYDDVLSSLHLYRPRFLVTSNGRPLCYTPFEFQHNCLLQSQLEGDPDDLHGDDGLSTQTMKCVAEPYVGSKNFQSQDVAINLARIIKEIRILFTSNPLDSQPYPTLDFYHSHGEAKQCTYFAKGLCNKGNQCLFSHSIHAQKPACKFFFSFQGCRNGELCYFSHASDPSVASFEESSICMPEDRRVNSAQMLRFFPKTAAECVLLLDESNLHFSSYLSREGSNFTIFTPIAPPKATTSSRLFDSVRILWSSHNSGQSTVTYLEHDIILWDKVKSVFWFPTFDSCGNNKEEEKNLVKIFFQDMALKMLRDSMFTIRLIITMNNIRFSQIQVEKWARNCFFFLGESFPFDESNFGELQDEVLFKKAMVTSQPISYVFHMHPTKDIRSYANSLQINEPLHELDRRWELNL